MKGFNQKEIELLISSAKWAKTHGESLSNVFENVAKLTGRAKGSVRNFYYLLMKTHEKQTNSLIAESGLKVEKNIGFTKTEEENLVKSVLEGVKDGKSVRRAIIDLADGDGKMELRIQNKYRNLVKNSPTFIEKIAKEINLDKDLKLAERKKDFSPYIKKVADEIDTLVERLKDKYLQENRRLAKENLLLKKQVDELSARLGISTVTQFFSKDKKSI